MRYTANMYKMLLFLLQHELEQTGEVYDAPRLVEMLLGHAGAAAPRWHGPVDFTLLLDEFEPQRATETRDWLQQLANIVSNAIERYPSPGFN